MRLIQVNARSNKSPAKARAGQLKREKPKAREAALADPEGKALGGALGKPVTWLKPVRD